MDLWVFGDSYSISHSIKDSNIWHYETNWIDIIGRKLGVDNIQYNAEFGVSNEWILKSFILENKKFKSNDIVIIQLTSGQRRWFFEDVPALSNIKNTITTNLTKDQSKAIDYYLRHLQNDNLDNIIYSGFVYAFLYFQAARPDIKMIFLPGFNEFPNVKGNLTDDVCIKEFETKTLRDKFYNKHKWDPRLNHMTIDNHFILADKVIDNIQNNTPIDLTTGFKTNIYTKDNI